MKNYMDGNWHDWHGGECPVPGDVEVEAIWTDEYGIEKPTGRRKAKNIVFHGRHQKKSNDPITRFRVLNPQPTQTGPVRTVTRTTTEIVNGVHGSLYIKRVGPRAVEAGLVHANGSIGCPPLTERQLRQAAAYMIDVADALAEQETQA